MIYLLLYLGIGFALNGVTHELAYLFHIKLEYVNPLVETLFWATMWPVILIILFNHKRKK